jgi:anti-anti-sigma regulatory factor
MTQTTAMAETVIRPAEALGPVLTSRTVAEALRASVEETARTEGVVVVDFSGVEAMSPSFADELFAKVPHELVEAGHIRFENLDDDLLQLMRYVVAGREASADTA